MKEFLRVVFVIVILLGSKVYGQASSASILAKDYISYHKQAAPDTYLHLNKEVFYTTDNIYFKAYVKPFNGAPLSFGNLNIKVYTEQGKQIDGFVFPIIEGKASGNLKVPLSPWLFYIKSEVAGEQKGLDLFSIYKIRVIAPATAIVSDDKKTIPAITVQCEGGDCIAQRENALNAHLTGLDDEVSIANAWVVYNDSDEISKLNVIAGHYVYGNFNPKFQEGYALRIQTTDNVVLSQEIKINKDSRVGVRVNPLVTADLLVSLSASAALSAPEKYMLAFHNGTDIRFAAIEHKTKDQVFSFPKDEMFDGVNVITLFDANNTVIFERLVFNTIKNTNTDANLDVLVKQETVDTLKAQLQLKSDVDIKTLSLSILPQETKAKSLNSIDDFFFSQYIKNEDVLNNQRLGGSGRMSQIVTDIFLQLYGERPFSWEAIKRATLPKPFKPQQGFTVSGEIDLSENFKFGEVYWYQQSTATPNSGRLDDDGTFSFNNTQVLKDESINLSATFNRNIVNDPNITLSIHPQLNVDTLDTRPYLKTTSSSEGLTFEKLDNQDIRTDETLALNAVNLTATKKKPELVRNPQLGSFYEGRKVTIDDVKRRPLLSQYIRSLGFRVRPDANRTGNFVVLGRTMLDPSPLIFVDGFGTPPSVTDYTLESIDEVYYEKQGILGNPSGSIYIYRMYGGFVGDEKEGVVQVLPNGGFEKFIPYKNPVIAAQLDTFQKQVSELHWEPNVSFNDRGLATVVFPNYKQESFIMILEGFDETGNPIHLEKLINLE